ncbi:MAG: hypothetical protein ACRDHM_11405, partial [Actinomycetota bacterium]
LRLLSGADGTRAWTRSQRASSDFWEFPVLLEDLTGDGVSDLVLGSFMTIGDPFEGENGAGFARVYGRTGNTISETTHVFPSAGDASFTGTFSYIGGIEDVDGDARGDVLAGALSAGYNQDPVSGEYELSEVRSAAVFESGPSGTVLYEKSEAEPFTIDAPADVSGDGRIDALEWRYPVEEGGDYGVVVQTLAPTTTLWARTMNEDEFWHLWVAGDQDGDSGEELLTGRNDLLGGHWSSFVASLKGASGSERWRAER